MKVQAQLRLSSGSAQVQLRLSSGSAQAHIRLVSSLGVGAGVALPPPMSFERLSWKK